MWKIKFEFLNKITGVNVLSLMIKLIGSKKSSTTNIVIVVVVVADILTTFAQLGIVLFLLLIFIISNTLKIMHATNKNKLDSVVKYLNKNA